MVNCLVIKPTLCALLAVLSLCLCASAQETSAITREELQTTGEVETARALSLARPDIFQGVDGSVLIHGLPVLMLIDGRRVATLPQLGRVSAFDLPVAFLSGVDVLTAGDSLRYGSGGSGGVVDLRMNRIQSGGEVGVFYGRSSGKYGREDFSTYMLGGVGNDKFNITAGAFYQESTTRFPRSR